MDKRIDASDLTRPLPAWRWLVWFAPIFREMRRTAPEYLVGGSDDLTEAEALAAGNPQMRVVQNPRWRTLN